MFKKAVVTMMTGILPAFFLAAVPAAGDEVRHVYNIEVTLFSVQEGPQGPVKESHRYHGSGSAQAGSTVGLSCGDEGFQFEVRLHPTEENGELFVDLEVNPKEKSEQVQPRKERLAMDDLKPMSLDLARDARDQRVYRVNLMPSVNRIDKSKQALDESSLRLDRWSFDGSNVIVDNWRYAGTMNCSGMSLAFVDVPGYARVEFALVPFPEAQPTGVLENGVVVLDKEAGVNSPRVVIDNVKVGNPPLTIPGGRYEVWVRWSPCSNSVTEAVREIAELDLEKTMADANLDDTTKAQLRARQQAVKEKGAELDDDAFATDGVISQVLGAMGMASGGGPVK